MRRIWTNATRRVKGCHSGSKKTGPFTFLRERYMRHHGPRLLRSAAGNRGHLPRGESMVTCWRPYKYDECNERQMKKVSHCNSHDCRCVTGMSRWYAVTFGEISRPVERNRTVRNCPRSFCLSCFADVLFCLYLTTDPCIVIYYDAFRSMQLEFRSVESTQDAWRTVPMLAVLG